MPRTYREWEEAFPGYVIIKLEGFFYSAHGDSARLISDYVGYRLGMLDGEEITGSPDPGRMENVLTTHNVSFVVIEADGRISARHDGLDYRTVPTRFMTPEQRRVLRVQALLELRDTYEPKIDIINEFERMINDNVIEGIAINHMGFGVCIVKKVEDGRIVISCDEGEKKLGIKHCLLNKLITIPGISSEWIEKNKVILSDITNIQHGYTEVINELHNYGV